MAGQWGAFPFVREVVLRRLLFISAVSLVAALLLGASRGGAVAPARGDADCSGNVDGLDALDVLLSVSGAQVGVATNCSAVGTYASGSLIGDANCDRQITVLDALDTLAIAGGMTLAPCYTVTESNNKTVSQVIGMEGGTLSTTGNDGSSFVLTIPAGALSMATTIDMSPVAAISGLPGGLVAAADLRPAGLFLWAPATLSITPSSPPSGAQTAFVIDSGQLRDALAVQQAAPPNSCSTTWQSPAS